MLRREVDDGWFLINQSDHAVLSYEIMRSWGRGIGGKGEDGKCGGFYVPQNFEEVLFAIRVHDGGWEAWERSLKIDPSTNYPMNFMEMDPKDQREIWERCFTEYAESHPYASALIALHFSVFNDRSIAKDPGNGAAANLRASIKETLSKLLELPPDERSPFHEALPEGVRRDLRLLQIGDLISLALCHGWRGSRRIDDAPRESPLEPCDLELSSEDGVNFRIAPYPFGDDEVRVSVRARRLRKKKFISDEELMTAVSEAPYEILDFSITK